MGAEERRCHVFVFFSKFYNYNNETIARMSRFPSEAIISSAGVRLADRAITTWDATSMLWPTSVPALPCASEWCNCQLRDTSMDYENVKDGERKRHTIDYNKVCRFRILGYQFIQSRERGIPWDSTIPAWRWNAWDKLNMEFLAEEEKTYGE